MMKKIEDDVKSEYLVVFGIVSFVLFLLVIAITSKHINSKEDSKSFSVDLIMNQHNDSITNGKNISLHSIREIYEAREISSQDYYFSKDSLIDFIYFAKQHDRIKDNWEFKNN